MLFVGWQALVAGIVIAARQPQTRLLSLPMPFTTRILDLYTNPILVAIYMPWHDAVITYDCLCEIESVRLYSGIFGR